MCGLLSGKPQENPGAWCATPTSSLSLMTFDDVGDTPSTVRDEPKLLSAMGQPWLLARPLWVVAGVAEARWKNHKCVSWGIGLLTATHATICLGQGRQQQELECCAAGESEVCS